ncbi:ATPase PAAT isoform X2 [Acanthochromis polyacanthus]|uniref:ATPase PAAT isoform X2 n=1 Tax=Acanthochromis polyacanthus TaxID=80966 RepID=UPI00223480F1|nr:ATPase PAAT isoform X2 [Acanthochromis polyacanthus]
MVDIAVKSEAAWVCHTEGRNLADVLLPVSISNRGGDEEELSQTNQEGTVLLQQMEEGSPCVLTLHCSSSAAISRLLVVSEARTLEVYDQTGEYCGTVRGSKDDSIQPDSADRGPFYKKQLILEHPSSSCEVKLLSLAGRNSVLVSRVVVGLQALQPCPARGPGIDMQQVQCLVEEMGTNLSPGAQSLMDMVQFQQKNQTGSLGGFLPLLMGGGGFAALASGFNMSPASIINQPADFTPMDGCIGHTVQNGGMSESSTSTSSSSPDLPPSSDNANNNSSGQNGGPFSHAQLAEMMSHFLTGAGHGQTLTSDAELLPMLQNVCGQVTQLRLDDAAAERKMRNGSCSPQQLPCHCIEGAPSLHPGLSIA